MVRETDHGSKQLISRMARTGKVRVGVIGSKAAEAKAVGEGLTGDTVADIATIHEFGLGVPRRSFIADYVDGNVDEITTQLDRSAARILRGSQMIRELNLIGLFIQGQIQERISNRIPPELAQATIDRKGSSVPLIDTGQLRSSITYEVEGG